MTNNNKTLSKVRWGSSLALCAGIVACGGTATTPGDTSSSQPVQSSSAVSSSTPVSSSAPSSSSVASSAPASSSSSSASGTNWPLVVAINAGSNLAATFNGVEYQADKYANGGSSHEVTDPINGVAEDALFQTERWGENYRYEVPVTPGTFTISLHMAELYHNAGGLRTFDVSVEGVPVFDDLDLFSQVGQFGALTQWVENIPVSDGSLTIELAASQDAGTLTGFAIYSNDGELDTSVPVSNCNGYVGLTFDDGPTGNTRSFVNTLRQNNLMPVTFFVNGSNISDPSVIREMMTVGEVQNHAFTHDYLTSMSQQQVRSQLEDNNNAIQNAGAPKPTILRPPYGDYNATVEQIANQLGLYVIQWDVDSRDWSGASSADIVNAVNQLRDGQNILMHENQANTINPSTMSQIASLLESKGLCPGVIDPNTGRVVAPR